MSIYYHYRLLYKGVNTTTEYITTENDFNRMHVKCVSASMVLLCVIRMTETVLMLTVTTPLHYLANVARHVPETAEDAETFNRGLWINAPIAVAS